MVDGVTLPVERVNQASRPRIKRIRSAGDAMGDGVSSKPHHLMHYKKEGKVLIIRKILTETTHDLSS